MKKLLVAALMVVLATPAFAAIQNVKVSGDITESYLNDNNLGLGYTAGGVNPVGQAKQNVFLSQVRLRVDADLSDNVSTTVGLINERAWNMENSAASATGSSSGIYADNLDTNVQVYLASVTLREFLYSPLTLTIGRQVFNYGNGLIIGDGGPINTAAGNMGAIYADLTQRTAYDGVKAVLDYKPLTIDLIYFKNGELASSITGAYSSSNNNSSEVFGYNANYQLNDRWNTVVEQYLFARIDEAGFLGGPAMGQNKGNTLYVPGLRASTNPIKGLNVQGEIAWQLGNIDVCNNTTAPYNCTTGGAFDNRIEHRDAMAAQLLATYALPVLQKYKPTVNASYTYVSGDKNMGVNADFDSKSSKSYSAWDEFNTIQGAGTIYRAILPMTNENILSVGASVNPLEDVTLAATWTGLWAATRISQQNPLAIIQPDGIGVLNPLSSTATKDNDYGLGNEADINLTYNYTEDVSFGLSMGWFVPGSVISNQARNTASQAIADIGVKF